MPEERALLSQMSVQNSRVLPAKAPVEREEVVSERSGIPTLAQEVSELDRPLRTPLLNEQEKPAPDTTAIYTG